MKKIAEWFGRLSMNPTKVKFAILAFVVIALSAFATKCRAADDVTLSVETGTTYIRGETPVFGLTVNWLNAGPKDADFQCGLMLVGSTAGNRNQAGFQCLMVDGFGKFDIGLGLVALQNIDEYNGSHANFSLMLGYRFTDRFGLKVRHWSNAGTTDSNKGRDMLLVSYQF